jgi:putative flippase GtrA
MVAALTRLPPYLRYIGVSAAALGIDLGIFLALIVGGTAATLAAGIGYGTGIVVHWFLSSRMVFADRLSQSGAGRNKQKALFVVSAILGLGLTMAIVGGCTGAGIDARIAKIIAIGVSFNATYLLRKLVVFA